MCYYNLCRDIWYTRHPVRSSFIGAVAVSQYNKKRKSKNQDHQKPSAFNCVLMSSLVGRDKGSCFQQLWITFHVPPSILGLSNWLGRPPLVTRRMIWYSNLPWNGTVLYQICKKRSLRSATKIKKRKQNVLHNKDNQRHIYPSWPFYFPCANHGLHKVRRPSRSRTAWQTVPEQRNWTESQTRIT